ncbi:MAG: hypothetical protein HUJ97_10240 [Bacteroidales bacterium]|nr:hypothetical protein [Bacteroidales bacterium]
MNLVDSNRLKFYFLGLDDIYDEIPDDNNDVYGNDDVNENSACQLFKCEFPVSQSLTQLILERFSNFVLEFVEHNDKTNRSYPIDFTFSEVKYSDKERVVLSGQLIVSFNPIGVGTIEYNFKTQEYNRVSYSEKTTRSRKIHSLMVHNTELSNNVLDLVSRFNDLPF